MRRKPDNANALPALSRRGFFTLAAAMGLSTSSSFWEGFFVRAYADEAGTADYAIYVARRWEVPVCFLDGSDAANPRSVVGAAVTITSLYNGKSATGVTDELGVALIDISELAEPEPVTDSSVRTDYSFYGSLAVRAEGYRTYSTGRLRIRGGEQVDAPTRPLDGKPYLLQATIDGWDILHADEATFVATSTNPDAGHEAVITVAGCEGNVEVSLHQEGGCCHTTAASPVGGVASVRLSGQFFSTKAEDERVAFVPGAPILLSVSTADGGSISVTTSATCKLGTADAPVDETSDEAAGGQLSATSFLLDPNSISLIGIPESFPVLGGNTFNFESILPSFPLSLAYDPTGHIVAGIGYAGTLHPKSSGNGVWQHRTFQDARDEYQRSKEEWTNVLHKMKDNDELARLMNDKTSKCGKLAPISGFEMSFQCGGMVHMEYGDYLAESGSDDKFNGAAQLYAILSGEYSYTQPFVVLYVPLFVRFQVSAALRATIECGVGVTRDTGKFHLSKDSSFSLNLTPELAVTLGVGVADLVSVGVRGSGYLSAFMGVYFQPPEAGKANPRLSLEGGAGVSVVIQAFMFKGSVSLYSFDAVIADNWAEAEGALLVSGDAGAAGDADRAAEAYAMRLPGGSVGFPIESPLASSGLLQAHDGARAFSLNAVPVTASELLKSAEFKATAQQPDASVALEDGAEEAATPQHNLYSYEPLRQSTRVRASAASGLRSLGAAGAEVTGATVHEEAYSDPRMKIVVVDGTPWMLRILTVNYGTDELPEVRTRLSVARWAFDAADGESLGDGRWESAQVIDFTPVYGEAQAADADDAMKNPERIDLYDYDFAVQSAGDVDGLGSTWADGSAVRVFLTSGTREGVNSIGDAAAQTVGTFLALGKDFSVVSCQSFLDAHMRNFLDLQNTPLPGTALTHSLISYPFVLSDGAGSENVTVIFGFYRMAESAEALLSGPYYEAPATAAFDSNGAPLVTPAAFTCATGAQNLPSKEGLLAFFGEVKHSVAAGIVERNLEGQGTITIGCHYVTDSGEGQVAKAFSLARRAAASTDGVAETGDIRVHSGESASRFVYPWASEGSCSALSATDGKLEIRSIDGRQYEVSATPISLDNGIDLSSFALDPQSGMLYYATARAGSEHGHDENGSVNETTTEVADYRIWATRCITVNGETGFMKPFPLIQADQPIDSLEYLDLGDSYGFMANAIQSMQDSTSRIMLYRLPYLKRVTLLDFGSVNRYVCADEDEAFRITVRNDGNVSLSSFSICITVGGKEYQVDLDLAKTDEVIPLAGVGDATGSAASLDESQGTAASTSVVTGFSFDLATKAGLLNPGVVRSYEFIWHVPAGLSGETPLTVTVLEDGTEQEGSQSSNGVSISEGTRFASNASFASTVDGGIAASSLGTSVLFRVPAEASTGQTPDDPEKDTEDTPTEPGSAIPGESGGLSKAGDSLSSTAAAALLAGLGLAGMGVAAKKLGEQEDDSAS